MTRCLNRFPRGWRARRAILFRGAGFDIVWPQSMALTVIGAALFAYTLANFRSIIGTMA